MTNEQLAAMASVVELLCPRRGMAACRLRCCSQDGYRRRGAAVEADDPVCQPNQYQKQESVGRLMVLARGPGQITAGGSAANCCLRVSGNRKIRWAQGRKGSLLLHFAPIPHRRSGEEEIASGKKKDWGTFWNQTTPRYERYQLSTGLVTIYTISDCARHEANSIQRDLLPL